MRLLRLYFGNIPIGEATGPIEPWPAGEELVVMVPAELDPEIKRLALAPLPPERLDAEAPPTSGARPSRQKAR